MPRLCKCSCGQPIPEGVKWNRQFATVEFQKRIAQTNADRHQAARRLRERYQRERCGPAAYSLSDYVADGRSVAIAKPRYTGE